jgi:HEAT repeat protein
MVISVQAFGAEPSQSSRAWTILETGAYDQNADRRAEAVSAVGLLAGNQKAVGIAEQALKDPKPEVCRAAVTALGEMNAKASLPKIKELADRADAKTVLTIAEVLKRFHDPEGYEIYYEVLTGKLKGGGSVLDGLKDKKSLEKMGVEAAIGFVPFGGIGTGAYDYLKRNGAVNATIEARAATALAHDPDPQSEKALIQASFGANEVVEVAALRALAKRGHSTVVAEIGPAMYSDKTLVSYTAAAAILHLIDLQVRHKSKK